MRECLCLTPKRITSISSFPTFQTNLKLVT